MSSDYQFTENDTGSVLRVTHKYVQTSAVIDLTGKTAKLLWRDSSGVLQSRDMTAVTPSSGKADYQFLAGELTSPSMRFRGQVVDALGKTITSLKSFTALVARAA
jgi:hypothetical protein